MTGRHEDKDGQPFPDEYIVTGNPRIFVSFILPVSNTIKSGYYMILVTTIERCESRDVVSYSHGMTINSRLLELIVEAKENKIRNVYENGITLNRILTT